MAKPVGTVAQACTVRGYRRDSVSRFTGWSDGGGAAAFQALSRRTPMLKNRVAPESDAAGVALAREQPAGGARASGHRTP